MIKLEEKYVLHIPSHKYVNGELIYITTQEHMDELIKRLNREGYTSFYALRTDAYYKTRKFDQILITIYTSKNQERKSPDTIFKEWFKQYNHILKQEAFAYEYNDSLIVEKIE